MSSIPLIGAQVAVYLRLALFAAVFAAGAGASWWGASVWYGLDVARAEGRAAEAGEQVQALAARAARAESDLLKLTLDANSDAAAAAEVTRLALLPVFDRLKKEAANAKARSDAACRLDADWLRRYNEALVPARAGAVPGAAGGPDPAPR